jgi:F-type H+-transporting ATPase subunit a
MEVHVAIAAEELFTIGPLSFTNSMFTMLLVMGFMLIFGIFIARRLTMVPGRLQGAVEIVIEALNGLIVASAGKTFGRKILPLISGLFLFILLANYSGLLPGVGTIGIYKEGHHTEGITEEEEGVQELGGAYTIASVGGEPSLPLSSSAEEGEEILVPLLRPPTADLNMTLAMSLVTFSAVQVLGIRAFGFRGRIKHMADPPFLFPIELISELSRIISLSARLFGNVFAGEVLLTVMYTIAASISIAVIPLLVPVIFLFLEALFGAIQALVFALLTLIYIVMASTGHDEHDHEHEGEQTRPAATATSWQP